MFGEGLAPSHASVDTEGSVGDSPLFSVSAPLHDADDSEVLTESLSERTLPFGVSMGASVLPSSAVIVVMIDSVERLELFSESGWTLPGRRLTYKGVTLQLF